ncbi:DUF2946 domain-containing protein [Salmonella enterica subsp. enterica serovar Mbandaka]|nr:DUF2946 domain-containing protein [Salmonella enterica subsp. enterica serovar Mbandaka]
MLLRRLLRNRMRRFGTVAVAVVFLLQTFAVASMPLVSISADEEMVIICTGSGMKTVPLSDFGVDLDLDQDQPGTGTMQSGGMCALCPLAHCVGLPPSMAFLPALDLNTHAPQAPPTAHFVAEGFRTAHQARAPPSNN